MNRQFGIATLCVALATGVLLSAQFPDEPPRAFGAGITGSFEGWFDNADGSHSFLVGYLNRNRAQDVDVSIGPDNRIEPGGPDMGQPTHFLAGRQSGMFIVTVPKTFAAQDRLTWTLTVNGQTTSIPLHLVPDYVINPLEEASVRNTPPTLHLFDAKAPGAQGPIARLAMAIARTTTMSTPLPLSIWAEDDAHYTNNSSVPMARPRPPVTVSWTQYRGPGKVTFEKSRPPLETLKGGAVDQPYTGRAATTATFSEPGEYVLHLLANDYSGTAGGGFLCCWSTALVKVTVTP
jgi:hypothetical protein